jgi:formyltetrahydrofolate deformylase
VLVASCRDVPGISAAVTAAIWRTGGFIVESQQFGDAETGLFFVRMVFATDRSSDIVGLRDLFAPVGGRFGMDWTMTDAADRPRTLIAVSRFGHCLNDLLHRWRTGALPIDIAGVMSNHEDLRSLVEWHGLPFHHLPVTPATRATWAAAFGRLIDASEAQLVVLARYMQVLPDALVDRLASRCINIHHSFLPSFKGARPYDQAHRRGVKIIGATAHYVTAELDEGPIIEQDVERVGHERSPADLVQIGQDIEARVLARAVTWHAERRVLLNGAKTVVFR